MSTFMAKKEEVSREWYVIDATGNPLGRLASQVATLLRGKHKATYTPHVDTGDYVIIVNAEKVALTGKKLEQKMYYRHSGYPGGLRAMNYKRFMATAPEKAIQKAVWGMLPHNVLGRQMLKKLKVYKGAAHPHQAQEPKAFEFDV